MKRTHTQAPKASSLNASTTYGPSELHHWTVQADHVSFVRPQVRAKSVRLDAQPQCIEIDVVRTVLIVVDMQNDFCHPKGWFGQRGLRLKALHRPVAPLNALLGPWREAGGKVLWLNWGVRPDRLNLGPTMQFKAKRTPDGVGYAEHSPEDHGPSLVPGSWGAAVIDTLPVLPQDMVVFKHRLSGFWDSELDSVLRLQGATTLLFAGVNTDRCVFSTLQDANFLGYDCVLLEDVCSTVSPSYVSRAILYVVQQLHGFVSNTSTLLEGLARLKPPKALAKRPSRKSV